MSEVVANWDELAEALGGSVFEDMLAQPVRISGPGSVVDRNVVVNSVMSAIMIRNGDDVLVTNNLVLSTHCMDFCAGCWATWLSVAAYIHMMFGEAAACISEMVMS